MNFTYKTKGVCSQRMDFEFDGNVITEFTVIGGCQGNLAGIKKLIEGMDIDEVITKLHGVTCGPRPTSCPDQIAEALLEYKESISN